MKAIKRIFSFVPPFALWLMLCVLVWGFVFLRITDAPRENKLVICIDADVPGDTALAVYLEERLPKEVRMVQARPFTYAMFDSDALRQADLFIVKASHIADYRDWFAPLPESLRETTGALTVDGAALGLPAYEAETGQGVAAQYVRYASPGEEAEDYYLVFGASSLHNAEREQASDDWAKDAALLLVAMQ